MRIALSGTHAVGKSTLLGDLHQLLPAYEVVEEPYYELLDEGHLFADKPAVEDFLAQLERSIERLRSDAAAHVLYDRCPADFLAYLSALDALDSVREALALAGQALRTLDLIVLLPIEQPDRIAGAVGADRLRRKVDAILREMLLEDNYGVGPLPVISVEGSESTRVSQVVAAMHRRGFRVRSGAL